MLETTNSDKTPRTYFMSRDLVLDRTQTYLALAHRGDDYEKELYYARNIGELKGANARLVSAQAIVDVAVRHGVDIVDELEEIYSEAMRLSLKSKRLDNLGLIALSADRLHSQLPLLSALSVGTVPTPEDLETSHTDNLSSIERIFSLWNKVKSTHTYNESLVKGFMSETAASLLLERWALEENVQGWLPTFTTLSDDHGNIINGGEKMGWDISIYTDTTTHPAHKLQIKTKYTELEEEKYRNQDIDFVPISMLCDENNEGAVMPQRILGDFLYVARGSEKAAERLDQRTEVLLDIFS